MRYTYATFCFSYTLQLLFAAMIECRDLAIFVLTNRPTEPITLPLVHVRGVMTVQGNLTKQHNYNSGLTISYKNCMQ